MVIGVHHFTHVKPFRLHLASAQDLHKQQGRHQFAVADQFVGQCRRVCQRRRFGQHGDVFQHAVDFFADNRRIVETIKDSVLDATDFIELEMAFVGIAAFGQSHQQVGDARRSGQDHQAYVRIGEYDVGAAVHGFIVSNAGAAEFGDNGGILGCCLVHVKTSCQGGSIQRALFS
ncbi:hypothetical protein D3C80_1048120 [compost metagenome]